MMMFECHVGDNIQMDLGNCQKLKASPPKQNLPFPLFVYLFIYLFVYLFICLHPQCQMAEHCALVCGERHLVRFINVIICCRSRNTDQHENANKDAKLIFENRSHMCCTHVLLTMCLSVPYLPSHFDVALLFLC